MHESLKIGEVAKSAGVTAKTIRFYERAGVLPPPARDAPEPHRRPTRRARA
jgi:DNA-binding transcriptional MerR regulator